MNGFLKGFVTGNRDAHIGIEYRLRTAINSARMFAENADPLSPETRFLLRSSPVYQHLLVPFDSDSSEARHGQPRQTWKSAPGHNGYYLTFPSETCLVDIPIDLCDQLGLELEDRDDAAAYRVSTYSRCIDPNGVMYTSKNYTGTGKFSPYIVIRRRRSPNGAIGIEGVFLAQRFIAIPDYGTYVEAVELAPFNGSHQDFMLSGVYSFLESTWPASADAQTLSLETIYTLFRQQFRTYKTKERTVPQKPIEYFLISDIIATLWCVTQLDGAGQPAALHIVRPYTYEPLLE